MSCGTLWVKKRTLWVWIAFDRQRGVSPIDFELGSRHARTGRRLWECIKSVRCAQYATDAWHAYTGFIPEALHTCSKRETYSIESFNATVRHYLARFHRKTHFYSKSVDRVRASLNLLFFKTIQCISLISNPLKDTELMLFDIDLTVSITPRDKEKTVVARTNYKEMYYSSAQQLAHHTSAGLFYADWRFTRFGHNFRTRTQNSRLNA